MNLRKILTLLALASFIGGCINTGRYQMSNDQAPLRKPTTLEMLDPKPEYQPIYPWSIKPYTILGKQYTPLKTAENYRGQGIASWYGRKFHGHLTANGEVYDMFAMSAAHKTLPIPSFVRVTNINNKKSIIVRVNDRGPFHDDRLIDLSYSAAYALDMLNTGTANVSIEAIVVAQNQVNQPTLSVQEAAPTTFIHPEAPLPPTKTAASEQWLFVQVIASSDGDKIKKTATELSASYNQPSHTPQANGIYKLRLGPLQGVPQAQALISALKNNGYPNAYMLYTAPALPHN